MPELPEVEVVRAGLEPAVTGARVTSVAVFDERSLRRHDGPAEDFIDRLVGRTLLAPRRRGKFMWIPLAPLLRYEMKDGARPAPGIQGAEHPDVPSRPSCDTVGGVRGADGVGGVDGFVDIGGRDESGGSRSGGGGSRSGSRSGGGSGSSSSKHGDVAAAPVPVGMQTAAPEALVTHLGMSGQVLLRDTATDDARTRIRVDLQHPGHGPLRLNFVDQRIFGSMAIDELVPCVDGGDLVPSKVVHIARDPLDERFDDRLFLSRLARKNTTIKRAMLDQTLISGIGNIYADESLWAARIHYDQPTATLSRPRAKLLLAEVRLVLRKALAEGGTSFDAQYLNVNGQSGYFAHSLNAYGQQGEPCPRCGRPIIRESFMNRGSHFCAHCQRVR